MAYTLTIDPIAHAQIRALPPGAPAALAEVMTVIALVPGNAEPFHPATPDGGLRKLVFGPRSEGLVVYLLLEDQHRVDVLRVLWITLDHE